MSEKWPDDVMTPREVAEELDEVLMEGGTSLPVTRAQLVEWRACIAQILHEKPPEGQEQPKDGNDS